MDISKYQNDWSIVGYIDQAGDDSFTWIVIDHMLSSFIKIIELKNRFKTICIWINHDPDWC